MRSFGETCERWDATFADSGNISDLRTAVRNESGQSPCTKGLRSICWKAFLLFENLDQSTWTKTLSDSRSAYEALRHHFLKDIEHPDNVAAVDPLTDDDRSPWSVLRQDEALRAEIFQDVERCMPENLYFRDPHTQAMLLDTLFIYCKLNPDVGYRQGMHEVLAPMLWVVSRDATDSSGEYVEEEGGVPKSKLIHDCFDSRFKEHDTFTLFGIVMQSVKSFYEVGSIAQATVSPGSSSSPIIDRSRRIHEEYLHQADSELADHLVAIGVLPQIFLIRWIRLLFGREFPLDDVLTVWDVLFAEDPSLDIIDLVCVSMLLRIRWQLLSADYSEALTLLFRYPIPPSPYGPASFVSDALYLRQNIMTGGGAQIIKRYSEGFAGRSEAIEIKTSQSHKRSKHTKEPKTKQSFSPSRSASRFLHEQGGIDNIIQEAAKGVYNRSEKWGVNKALRGAVEGLQSGASLSRGQFDASRWSLDQGRNVPSSSERAVETVSLEQRSIGLAKLLENAISELWEQQQQCSSGNDDSIADALSLAIAKVQFVQVYLENPTMPFGTEQSESEQAHAEATRPLVSQETPPAEPQGDPAQAPDVRPQAEQPMLVPSNPADAARSTENTNAPPNLTSAASVADARSPVLPFHRPRPSLAQSSFSWMLGEDQRKSSFVSPSPFPSEKRAAREKVDFLFGEGKAEKEGKSQKERSVEDGEEEEVINLGTLRVRR